MCQSQTPSVAGLLPTCLTGRLCEKIFRGACEDLNRRETGSAAPSVVIRISDVAHACTELSAAAAIDEATPAVAVPEPLPRVASIFQVRLENLVLKVRARSISTTASLRVHVHVYCTRK